MEKKKSYKWIAADLIFMYIITGLSLVLIAFLMGKFDLGGSFVSAGITVTYILSTLIGGVIAGKKGKTKKFLWGMAMGAAYFAILFAVSVAVDRGLPKDILHSAVSFGICIAGGTLGGMIG